MAMIPLIDDTDAVVFTEFVQNWMEKKGPARAKALSRSFVDAVNEENGVILSYEEYKGSMVTVVEMCPEALDVFIKHSGCPIKRYSRG